MVFGRWLTSGNRVNLCYELVALVVGHRERKGKTSPGLADDDALEAAKLLKINDNTVTQIPTTEAWRRRPSGEISSVTHWCSWPGLIMYRPGSGQ